jgi:hypothetical protein
MIDPLQQSQQALHVSTPFVQYVVSISGFGEVDNPCWSIDLGIHRLRGYQLTDVFLRLVFCQIEELSKARHLDASIVFGNNSDIVFNDTLAQILPSLVRLRVGRLARDRIKDIGCAEMGTKQPSDFWPSHELMNGEELEELCVERDLLESGVFVDSVEEIGLFVVIWGEDNVVDSPLQDLTSLAVLNSTH